MPIAREDKRQLISAVAKIKIGPVGGSFKGKVQLSDIDPPNGYTISGEGEGGIAGFAWGGGTLHPAIRRHAGRPPQA